MGNKDEKGDEEDIERELRADADTEIMEPTESADERRADVFF